MTQNASLIISLLIAAACGSSSAPTAPAPATPAAPAPAKPASRPEALPAPPTAEQNPPVDAGYLADCQRQLAAARVEEQAVIASPPGVDTTFEAFNLLSIQTTNAASNASLMQSVSPDPGIREAAQRCEAEVNEYLTNVLLDRRIYEAIAAVDVAKADAATQRLALTTLRDFRRAGVLLDDAGRQRMVAIEEQLTALGQAFDEAIATDTRYIEVTDPKRLAGLPADWIAAHPAGPGGVIKISTDHPDYTPFMTYAEDDALRKELYVKFRSRGDVANEGVLAQILALRAEEAKLLGFATWAEYQSDDKMLRGGKAAQGFIDRIATLAKARGQRDYAELLAQWRRVDPKATAVADWQKAFAENRVKLETYKVDSEEVRKYFPYDQTLAGLLAVTSEIYDVQYVAVPTARVWAPDVAVYDVMRGSEQLGRIFLDMHPRANKYKHAAEFTILQGVIGTQRPEGALVCNFPAGKDLMEHDDVVTMFHEFGHLMHHVLGGKQRWVMQSGVANELDFVEAPSQMFEEWGWTHAILARFAKHAETGAAIPEPLVAAMRRADKFGVGLAVQQQMFYAAIALQFHTVDPEKLDQLATVKALQTKYTPFAYVEGTRFHTSFGHLNGYSSMYYTYMWSLVIAKDLLTPFARPGLMSTAITYKYRDRILAAGGTKPAADLVRDFLGRPYNFKAFQTYLAK